MAKRRPASSRKRAGGFEQARGPIPSTPSTSAGLNQARPPQALPREAFAGDARTVAEMYGVEPGLIEALDELEARLDLGRVQEAARDPAAFAAEEGSLGLENILGYGVGLKVSNGRLTATQAVKVYVRQKARRQEIAEAEIPPEINGYLTDVEPIAPPVAYNGRVSCGSGCSVEGSGSFGTIGCLCVRDNKPMILSNNHVLANINQAAVGANINSHPAGRWIGTLEDFIPLRSTNNEVDAAIAWTNIETAVSPAHRFYRMDAEPAVARIGMTVKKEGARTGFTLGVVKDRIRLLPGVDYRPFGQFSFQDVIVVESLSGSFFSQPGDSGSIIVSFDGNRPVALLFAGGGTVTFANPVHAVMRALRIERFLSGDE